jgi:signal transduction histidine kinase
MFRRSPFSRILHQEYRSFAEENCLWHVEFPLPKVIAIHKPIEMTVKAFKFALAGWLAGTVKHRGRKRWVFLTCVFLGLAPDMNAGDESLAPAETATNQPAPKQVRQSKTLPFVEFKAVVYGGRNIPLAPLSQADMPRLSSGYAMRVYRFPAISLPQNNQALRLVFDYPDGATRWATRLQYKLEGYDADWRDLDLYYMHLVLKFLDRNRSPVSRQEFRTAGNSVGWNNDLGRSKFTKRVEHAMVPDRSAWMSIWVDSGGHDETTGVWLLDDIRVLSQRPGSSNPETLFHDNFETGQDLDKPEGVFSSWVRDGGALGGARVWHAPSPEENHALMILDSNPHDYSAWRLNDANLIPVIPGEKLTLSWREIFSIGCGRGGEAGYSGLPVGHYQFRVREVNALGAPIGNEMVLPLIIAPPLYANPWFQAAVLAGIFALGLVVERMFARARMRRQLEALERRQAVQQERARIARDIHDDLGTVLSRISMVSESAALNAEAGSRQQQRLQEICDSSRQLTHTMEEIVWAQDPKRDYLDNMADYFSSFATNLLAGSRVACRLDIPVDLPSIQLDAQKRHELFLVFKESLNNVIKHGAATEVRISLTLVDHTIHLKIEDNGRGFNVPEAAVSKGNGLPNMRTRLQRVGGRVVIQSEPGRGTRVEIVLPIDSHPAKKSYEHPNFCG